MQKILLSVAIVVGLLATFELGLLFFPWTGPAHLTAGQLTLVEKNQRLWERFAPISTGEEKSQGSYCDRHPDMRACLPYKKDAQADTAQSRDGRVDVLLQRVARLEARMAEMEAQAATQASTPSNATSQECSEVRREAMAMPSRFRYGFLDSQNCATLEDRLNKLEGQIPLRDPLGR